eukprot:gene2639-280_t
MKIRLCNRQSRPNKTSITTLKIEEEPNSFMKSRSSKKKECSQLRNMMLIPVNHTDWREDCYQPYQPDNFATESRWGDDVSKDTIGHIHPCGVDSLGRDGWHFEDIVADGVWDWQPPGLDFSIRGWLGSYPINMYFTEFAPQTQTWPDIQARLLCMKEKKWIDEATRMVIVSFFTYAPSSEIFQEVKMFVEIDNTGGIFPMKYF